MNLAGRCILKTTTAILGAGALGVLGSGTALAVTAPDLGAHNAGHGTAIADGAHHSAPASSRSGGLHTFVTPNMAARVAEPSARYDDNNYNNDNSDRSDYRSSGRGYDNLGNDNGRYSGNYDNGYSDNGYSDNGYRNNGSGLLGGGLLGGSN